MNSVPKPGTVVDGAFEILDLIGEGGMGQVYRARQIELDRIVAIKVLHSTLITDDGAYSRFEREGKVLAELKHPNIPEFYKFGIWNEQFPYIAMEFFHANSLQEVIQSGPLFWRRCINIMVQTCDALEQVHACGFCHRDLKPGNILVLKSSGEEVVKVVDFGLAGIIADGSFGRLTESGVLVGSVSYMSPEQCTGQKSDHRADIYALGAILQECLSGSVPFDASNPIAVMQQHVLEKPRSLSALAGRCFPQGLEDIVSKCLSKDPSSRYSSAQELKLALMNITEQYAENDFNVTSRLRHAVPSVLPSLILLAFFIFTCVVSVYLSRKPNTPLALKAESKAPHSISDSIVLTWAEQERKANPQNALIELNKFTDGKTTNAFSLPLCIGHTLKALILEGQDMSLKAIDECHLAIQAGTTKDGRTNPLCGIAYQSLSKNELLCDKPNEAITHAEMARRLVKENRIAIRGLPPKLRATMTIEYQPIDELISTISASQTDFQRAIRFWQEQISLDPSDNSAMYWQAKTCLHMNKLDESRKIILKALNQRPDDMELITLWLDQLYEEGRPKAARNVIDRLEDSFKIREQRWRELNSNERISDPERSKTAAGLRTQLLSDYNSIANNALARQDLQTALRFTKDALRIGKTVDDAVWLTEISNRAASIGSNRISFECKQLQEQYGNAK